MFSCRITSALRPLDNIRFVVRSSIKARRHVSSKNTLQQSPFWGTGHTIIYGADSNTHQRESRR